MLLASDSSLTSPSLADPFLTPGTGSNRARLSPTAASFTPVGMHGTVAGGSPSQYLGFGRSVSATFAGNSSGPNPLRQDTLAFLGRGMSATSPFRNSPERVSGVAVSPGRLGPDLRSRALLIENVPTNVSYMSLANFFNVSVHKYFRLALDDTDMEQRNDFGTLKGPALNELTSTGKVYVAFADSREAKKATDKIRRLRPQWHVVPLTARDFVEHTEPSLVSQTSNFEGHLSVVVYYDSRNPSLNHSTVSHSLEAIARTFGDMKSFATLPSGQDNVSEFHVEFYNTRDAENAMSTLNGTTVDVSWSLPRSCPLRGR